MPGSIDGKFEHSYLVTMTVVLLYHARPTGARPRGASVLTFMNSIITGENQIGRRRKRKEMSKDPNSPIPFSSPNNKPS